MANPERNTRYTKQINGEDFRRELKLPKEYESDPRWIRIQDFETYKKIFPVYTWSMMEYQFEDWACYIHITDPVFSMHEWGEILEKAHVLIKDNMIVQNQLFTANKNENSYYVLNLNMLVESVRDNTDFILDYNLKGKEVILISKKEYWKDTTVDNLKEFLRFKELSIEGKKEDLIKTLFDKGYKKEDVTIYLHSQEEEVIE